MPNTQGDDDAPQSFWARVDERLKNLERRAEQWVTKEEIWATKAIALGLAALVLSTVLAIILARVLGR